MNGTRFFNPTGILTGIVLTTVAQVISYGRFETHALVLVILGLGAAGWAILFPTGTMVSLKTAPLVIGIAAILLTGIAYNPLTYSQSSVWLPFYRTGCMFAAVFVFSYLWNLPLDLAWISKWRFGILIAIGVVARLAVPFVSPQPGEDVWVVQQEAAAAVLQGQDPYSVAYSQIFDPRVYAIFGYRSGFHYPPLALIPIVPAYLFFGDIRWAYIISELFLIAALWWLAFRCIKNLDHSLRELFVLLWVLNPSILFVLEHSWTEPFGLALLAGAGLLLLNSSSRAGTILLALFFSYKQYTILLFPLLLFLPQIGLLLVSFVIINLVSYIPWLFIGMNGLIGSLMEPWKANPRADGLSLAALWMNVRQALPPSWLSPLAMLGGLQLSVSRLNRGFLGLLAAIFILLGMLFITAKQSFCNYYYFLCYILILIQILNENDENRGDGLADMG